MVMVYVDLPDTAWQRILAQVALAFLQDPEVIPISKSHPVAT
jgi:hypothetical protein